ncbi:MAG TPA: ABC transporter ATP-binding protein [Vicinamibacterales bacterium]|nr:ABC transporter ATP-binding protein [Vicinamibacterales bacterium]
MPDRRLLRWIGSHMTPYRWRLALLAFVSVIEVAVGALTPWPLKIVVDNVLVGHPLPHWAQAIVNPIGGASPAGLLAIVLVAGLVLQVSSQVISMWHTQIQVDTGQRMVYDLRATLFAHLQALDMQHHNRVSAGDAVYRLDADAYCIDNIVMTGLFPLASAALTLIVMLTILLRLDATLALLALLVVPFLYWILRAYTMPMGERAERVKELESTLSERLYETFAAIRVIKSFARETYEQQRYGRRATETMEARIRLTWQESLFSVGITSVTIIGTTLVLLVGGMHVLHGELTLGSLLVVIAYLESVYGPLSAIAHTAGSLQEAFASARRVRRTLDETPEVVEGESRGLNPARIRGHVVFDRVSFGYETHPGVLHSISFEARPGETVALVGLTGSGKTTAVSMIPRFYDPHEGRVLIDSYDVRAYDLRALRERIAIVQQDPVLFRGTIAENIRYGQLDAGPEEIRRAAIAAHADEFISRLERGYESEIGETGSGLSGGERQRMAIARAVLKDAPILILDEPTSSLDALSEEIVFNALRRLRAGRTTIVIAHRLSTIRDADRILVLDAGRIIASGRHEEILEQSDLYRRMWQRLVVGKSLDEPLTVDELAQEIR